MPESLTLAENDGMAGIIGCVQCGRPLPEPRRYEHLCSDECQKTMDAYIKRYMSRRPSHTSGSPSGPPTTTRAART